MATLYVENVPEDLYEALRERAKASRRSIAQEAIALLEQNVPTASEITRRRRFLEKALRMQTRMPLSKGPFPSTEEMVREDRTR
jgi:plasmid stability protein